jgi:hypothetical protein
MTNSMAAVLALFLAGLIGADVFLNDSTALLFLARKTLDLIEWLAFWR